MVFVGEKRWILWLTKARRKRQFLLHAPHFRIKSIKHEFNNYDKVHLERKNGRTSLFIFRESPLIEGRKYFVRYSICIQPTPKAIFKHVPGRFRLLFVSFQGQGK